MGDEIIPYERKKIDKDGYVTTETWVSTQDGHCAPLDTIISSFGRLHSDDIQDLENGKSIKDFRVRREINDYSKELLKKFKL
jgi:hypothetical protein